MPQEIIVSLINLGIGGVFLLLFVRGDINPKSVTEREIRRADAATEAASENASALKEVSGALTILTTELKSVKDEVSILRSEIKRA